ncbi:hypothetical protein [Phenylobacterium sp.]|uniref:hypothetical protein n=1 Tax=Phenylobacterium sp. TaxID=1871053 RepID=UPI0025ECECAE|nr:hypothetical protein [Phenylobacterium sp.]MBX3484761.1 hypothetical protein [Phenylobacterium sp.]
MSPPDFRADCGRCAALCCVAFHFERSDQFGVDKAAGEPCPHLDDAGGCAIHGRRIDRGFRGCVGYDCLGAGPWVTQVLFGGRSWLQDGALLKGMVEAFLAAERGRRLLLMLREAGKLDLPPGERRRLGRLEAAVEAAMADAAALASLDAEAKLFLRSLRPYAAPRPPA